MVGGVEISAVYFRLSDLCESKEFCDITVGVLPPTGSADRDILLAKTIQRERLSHLEKQLAAEVESAFTDQP